MDGRELWCLQPEWLIRDRDQMQVTWPATRPLSLTNGGVSTRILQVSFLFKRLSVEKQVQSIVTTVDNSTGRGLDFDFVPWHDEAALVQLQVNIDN